MEKKKVKFNGMDVFIIVVVFAVIAAGIWFLTRDGAGSASSSEKNVKVTSVLEVCGMEPDYAEKIKVGDVAMLGEKDKLETVVTDVEVLPAKTSGYDILTGKVMMSEIPGQVDVKITVESIGTENAESIKISGTALRVGQFQIVNSKGWAGSGYVVGVETSDIN